MLTRLAAFLFEPSDQITNDAERRAARITSILCFVALILRLMDNIGSLIVLTQATATFFAILFLTPVIFAIYILSRTKYAYIVAEGLVWVFFGIVIAVFFVTKNRSTDPLFWMLLPVTWAALLLSVRRTFAVWVIAIFTSVTLSYLYVNVSLIGAVRPIGLIFVIGSLLLAATSARQRDRTLIEKQTRELEEQKIALEDTNHILEKTVVGQSTKLRQNSAELAREKQLHYETELALQKKQRLEGLGLLAGGIAHDFNNLLTGIGNQIAIADYKLDADVAAAHKHIKKAAAQVNQTSTITRQLLAYASDSQNTTAQLDFRDLVIDMYSFLKRVIDKNVALVHDIHLDSDQPLEVWGDTAQLQQVVMNLIVNAADAITDGKSNAAGTVTVSLSNHQLTSSDARLEDMLNRDELTPGNYIELLVQDTGCGMDAETISKIFDPFFTTKQTGHGLGLSAVLGILRRHKAGLIVNSQEGIGTAFHVFVPEYVSTASDETLIPVSKLQTDSTSHATGLHILLIDDDIAVQEATAELLEILGHTVEVAANGQIGIKIFEATSSLFDLVWLDINMPVMGGIPTFHALREKNPMIPIVMHSGNSADDATSLFSNESATVFLPKPYTSKQMLNAIDSVMLLQAPL